MKKQLREWAILIGVMGVLFYTGLYTELAGFLQRIILTTGVMQAEMVEESAQETASYNFRLVDQQGAAIDFRQFEGKTVFLNFWATWCPPCIAEMPDIQDLYDKMQGENVAFVLISQDDTFAKAQNFVDRKGYTFPIYQMASSLPVVYHSRSIPTTFVISPLGKIIAKRTGMAKYDTEEFRRLLVKGKVDPPS
ncbi:MAG: TlpA disulfide reductase family protein [Reichenbachiella sp.]|uniref:TlpA family protein disulfide reductase n=1 Tax=Reichenbachiella sp. TaxID=2184521 RepID=UPI0032637CF1